MSLSCCIPGALMLEFETPASPVGAIMSGTSNRVPPEALQEYLQALFDSLGDEPEKRDERLLLSFAELQYRRKGSGRCAVCHTTVRHVLPVRSTHGDGTVIEYECLCMRCLAAERATSRQVELRFGDATICYRSEKHKPAKAAAPPPRRKYQTWH